VSALVWQVEGADRGQMIETARCLASGVEWIRRYDRTDRTVTYHRRQAWTREPTSRVSERDMPPDLQGWTGLVES